MWTVDPGDVAAGDRLFESHGKWMTRLRPLFVILKCAAG
jgi:hypothetical protein